MRAIRGAVSEFPEKAIDKFVAEQRLPDSYREQVRNWLLPLAWILRDLAAGSSRPLRIGVSGAQGSGKSTLAALLPRLLASWDLRAVSLSVDDFYLSRAQRLKLAETVHPMLATRGVPGTHEIELMVSVLDDLVRAGNGDSVSLPKFDKSIDDRVDPDAWAGGRPDLILLEGWFVGLGPQGAEELHQPVNSLETEEDRDGAWRGYVNDRLAEYHGRVFTSLDRLIFLCAPDFESVYRWRGLQEKKLRDSAKAGGAAIMNEGQLRRFIEHYERLTRHALATLPEQADWMFVLDDSQQIGARVDRLPDQALSASRPR